MGPFQNRPDPFKTVWTHSKPSGPFQNRPDHFKTVRTVLRLSGQFMGSVDDVEEAHTVLKLIIIISFDYEEIVSILSEWYLNYSRQIGLLKMNLLSYAQNFSGRANFFRIATLACYMGFWASG